MRTRKPSADLRSAFLSLDELEGVDLRLPAVWSAELDQWVLQLELGAHVASEHVPRLTDWVVLVDDAYPLGDIEFFPAATDRGLQVTFPHQRANTKAEKRPHRDGKLCLDRPGHLVDPFALGREPRGASTRLRWHVERALAWLAGAARGDLLRFGDPFELPVLPRELADTVAFSEGPDTYPAWTAARAPSGTVTLKRIGPKLGVTGSFSTWNDSLVAKSRWGTAIDEADDEEPCPWIRLEQAPTLPPWGWPSTWDELRKAAGASSLDAELRKAVRRFRDGKAHLLLIGFPIPTIVGGAPAEMHWAAARIGPLPTLKPGHSEAATWDRDRRQVFGGQRIAWCGTENWHAARLGARGQLSPALRERKIGLMGAGALGSMVAELLVRGGAWDLTLIDGERLEVGNLVRHVLSRPALGELKASALAAHLNLASPYARVVAVTDELPLEVAKLAKLLDPFDLIIDCTGSDDVLLAIARIKFEAPKQFVSASVGWACRRLFCFLARGAAFPSDTYWRVIAPWLEIERAEEIPAEQRWAGAGCWHPVFPAQSVDLSLMAAAATKQIEHASRTPYDGDLRVFEQTSAPNGFSGLVPADLGRSTGALVPL